MTSAMNSVWPWPPALMGEFFKKDPGKGRGQVLGGGYKARSMRRVLSTECEVAASPRPKSRTILQKPFAFPFFFQLDRAVSVLHLPDHLARCYLGR